MFLTALNTHKNMLLFPKIERNPIRDFVNGKIAAATQSKIFSIPKKT